MLHEFSVGVSFEEIDETIEILTSHGLYNLYYDQPIEIYADENGYGVEQKIQEKIELKVFIEDTEIEDFSPENYIRKIVTFLDLNIKDIQYKHIEKSNWQQPFPVIDLGNGWSIKSPEMRENAVENEIIFEPPRAFGSGLHETTQDCLRIILDANLKDQKVLDLGTGSGLLSVAASLMNAQSVLSIDIENVVDEVLYNAHLNSINNIKVIQGDVLSPAFEISDKFDWIFVNIAANEVKKLTEFINLHLNNSGRIILSGMVEWNYSSVIEIYTSMGFRVIEIIQSNEWVTLYMERP